LPTPVPAWITAIERTGSAASSSALPSAASAKVRATCSAIWRWPGRSRKPTSAATTASKACKA
jgi:hypothetical protein